MRLSFTGPSQLPECLLIREAGGSRVACPRPVSNLPVWLPFLSALPSWDGSHSGNELAAIIRTLWPDEEGARALLFSRPLRYSESRRRCAVARAPSLSSVTRRSRAELNNSRRSPNRARIRCISSKECHTILAIETSKADSVFFTTSLSLQFPPLDQYAEENKSAASFWAHLSEIVWHSNLTCRSLVNYSTWLRKSQTRQKVMLCDGGPSPRAPRQQLPEQRRALPPASALLLSGNAPSVHLPAMGPGASRERTNLFSRDWHPETFVSLFPIPSASLSVLSSFLRQTSRRCWHLRREVFWLSCECYATPMSCWMILQKPAKTAARLSGISLIQLRWCVPQHFCGRVAHATNLQI